ncbi:MAG: hypothetical protein LQ342_006131 [Letrouitia transgressa]|nr:MAG: hypothetical protein LQ342_006131 [Letrouitia transgressa]
MSDDVRRSGRATKGQHTKNIDTAETPTAKPRGRGKGSKAAKASTEPSPPAEDEGDAIIRCICGYVEEDEDDERKMVVCDSCEAWQHNECMEISENDDELPEQYFCEQCRPDLHKPLLEKVNRGEKPWEERARQRAQVEEERKARRRKGGKRGRKSGGRVSEIKADATNEEVKSNGAPAEPAMDATPSKVTLEPEAKTENAQKRKLPVDASEETKSPSQQEPVHKMRKFSSPTENKPVMPSTRRKSSAATTPAKGTLSKGSLAKRDSKALLPQMELVESVSDLQNQGRRKIAEALVKLFVDQTKAAQKDGAFTLPTGQSVDVLGNKLGLAVEYAVFLNFWGTSPEPSPQYAERFRMINHNVKQNPALRDRLLSGELSPNDFSKMSSFEMASKELQEKTAEMKKESEKQAMLVEEDRPRIRRTHKGEELVETDTHAPSAPDTVFSAPLRRHRPETDQNVPQQASPEPVSPQSPSAVELPENVGESEKSPTSTKPLSVDTKAPARPDAVPERKSSSNFNIQEVWSSVTGPDNDNQQKRLPLKHTESGNVVPQQQGPGAEGDADIDRLLKDEEQEEEEPYSPAEYPEDPSGPVWRGKLSMQSIAEFSGAAKHVAGANLNASLPWEQLMPPTLNIEGRIDIERANEYLCGLRWSHTTDVSVVSVTPINEESSQRAFDKLFQYFTDRKRYGVIGKNAVAAVKDTYLVPLEAGATKKPDFVEFLEHSIEDPIPERTLLIAFVIRLHNSPPQSTPGQSAPTPSQNAAIASPVTAGGHPPPAPFQPPAQQSNFQGSPTPIPYQGSPPQGYQNSSGQYPPFGNSPPQPQQPYPVPPQQSPYGQPYNGPFGMEAAKQALGDLANTPAVGALIREAPGAGIAEFQVVKQLFETVPATKENYELLTDLLKTKLQQQG